MGPSVSYEEVDVSDKQIIEERISWKIPALIRLRVRLPIEKGAKRLK
jgi:hypothetical protein